MLGLAFSGGKDSLACWYLHRHENPIVLWVNTGKAYPETVAIVDEIRAQAFRFVEVRSDQQAQIDANGLPSVAKDDKGSELSRVLLREYFCPTDGGCESQWGYCPDSGAENR